MRKGLALKDGGTFCYAGCAMGAERREHPDWANQEREGDLGWIAQNLDMFEVAAGLAYEASGRGALVVNTTLRAGPGHPFAYFSEEQILEYNDEDITRLVKAYDPQQEFVVVLIKSGERTSTYRIKPVRGN